MSPRSRRQVQDLIAKAEILLDALPYIRRFYGKTVVVKYGGHAMVDDALKDSFAQDVVLLKFVGMNPVIVHGGGPQIGQMLGQLGIESRFVRGMRVTDRPTMDVVEMVLVGKINKEIVSLVNRHGGRAVGLSGKDGNLIRGRKIRMSGLGDGRRGGLDMGMVGEVAGIDPTIIESLDRSDFIPVIAPVGVGEQGETYNINADLVAAKVAEALRAEKLLLLTDVEGIRGADGTVVPTLDAESARRLIARGVIGEGMIPKVECCLDALGGGVRKTHIVDGRLRHAILLEIFTREGVGTEVVRAPSRRGAGRPRGEGKRSAGSAS
jgi:acetylglutamate kinase